MVCLLLGLSLGACAFGETCLAKLDRVIGPRVVLDGSKDFSSLRGEARRVAFVRYLMPAVRYASNRVALEHEWLSDIKAGKGLPCQDSGAFLSAVAEKYGLSKTKGRLKLALLLLRTEETPSELVLAQAALESGWGGSRFAREANNYFGHQCFSEGCGLVPLNRGYGERREVRVFESPLASVEAYLLNLNTSAHYERFRIERFSRAHYRAGPCGYYTLLSALQKYAESDHYADKVLYLLSLLKGPLREMGLVDISEASLCTLTSVQSPPRSPLRLSQREGP